MTTRIAFTKALITGFAVGTALMVFSSKAFADTVCQPIYGGAMYGAGQQCYTTNLVVNKMVKNPSNGSFVDNLTLSDSKYQSGNTVEFKISVQNTGSTSLGIVTVVDTLPDFIDLDTVTGPITVDKASRKMTYTVNSLAAGETKEQIITGKIVDESKLPSDKGTVCVTNYVSATADNVGTASDSAAYCIGNNVLGKSITSTPSTGVSEVVTLAFGAMLATGVTLKLKRK